MKLWQKKKLKQTGRKRNSKSKINETITMVDKNIHEIINPTMSRIRNNE